MPRGITSHNYETLKVTNKLLRRKNRFLENRIRILEGRLYHKNGVKIIYVKTKHDKEYERSTGQTESKPLNIRGNQTK